MEEHKSKNTDHDEIDLGFLFQRIGQFFKGLLTGFLKIIIFYYRKKWILLGLVIIGGLLGYFWEQNSKEKYKNNFIVATNYNTTDYLYNKVEAIDSKIKLKDSTYLNKVFGESYLNVKAIEVEPIVSIYSFIERSESNRELFELLSEDEDMAEFIKKPVNSRNYPYHIINLIVEGEAHRMHEEVSDRFFYHINDNEFFNKAKEINLQNTLLQIDQNVEVRQQIDAVIRAIADQGGSGDRKTTVSIQDNQVIDDLLKRKDLTLNEDKGLKTRLENQQKLIQQVDRNYQIEFEDSILNKDRKLLLPLFFVLLFSLFYLIGHLKRKAEKFLEKQNQQT